MSVLHYSDITSKLNGLIKSKRAIGKRHIITAVKDGFGASRLIQDVITYQWPVLYGHSNYALFELSEDYNKLNEKQQLFISTVKLLLTAYETIRPFAGKNEETYGLVLKIWHETMGEGNGHLRVHRGSFDYIRESFLKKAFRVFTQCRDNNNGKYFLVPLIQDLHEEGVLDQFHKRSYTLEKMLKSNSMLAKHRSYQLAHTLVVEKLDIERWTAQDFTFADVLAAFKWSASQGSIGDEKVWVEQGNRRWTTFILNALKRLSREGFMESGNEELMTRHVVNHTLVAGDTVLMTAPAAIEDCSVPLTFRSRLVLYYVELVVRCLFRAFRTRSDAAFHRHITGLFDTVLRHSSPQKEHSEVSLVLVDKCPTTKRTVARAFEYWLQSALYHQMLIEGELTLARLYHDMVEKSEYPKAEEVVFTIFHDPESKAIVFDDYLWLRLADNIEKEERVTMQVAS